jgi:hypothetical protein
MPRFFSDSSFWNQPIAPNHAIDPNSAKYLACMAARDNRGLWINLSRYTVPIYEVNAQTPRRKVLRMFEAEVGQGFLIRSAPYLTPDHPLGHGPGFAEDAAAGRIPIPDHITPDPASDAHLALVDWDSGWAWDMWKVRHRPDGQWECRSGMKYRIDGSGVFPREQFAVHNGESIHPYGPGRAAGVPVLAGTILHEEILAGRIQHKISFASQAAGYQQFVYPPACWTDGGWRDGFPEGAILQLNPDLDLATLNLSPAALTIARALQEYGAVCVDVSGGHCLYGQGLYSDPHHRTWQNLLEENALIHVGFEHYRVLHMENVIPQGMGPRTPDGIYTEKA